MIQLNVSNNSLMMELDKTLDKEKMEGIMEIDVSQCSGNISLEGALPDVHASPAISK